VLASLLQTLQKLTPDQQRTAALERLQIRRPDADELEGLYRMLVFQDLPEREGRSEDLFNLIGTTIGEGLYICGYLNRALHLEGDICEFGIAQGATSRLLANEIRESGKNLWLFDSFEGLPEPSEKDGLIDDIFGLGSMQAYAGTMRCSPDEARTKLAAIGFPDEQIKIEAGWINETIAQGRVPEKVCFAYVDFDFYEPILDAMRYLDKAMPPGGAVVVDDYGFFSSGAASAVDEFVEASGGRWRRVMPLAPAGKFCVLLRTNV